jgi:hypothetical protein
MLWETSLLVFRGIDVRGIDVRGIVIRGKDVVPTNYLGLKFAYSASMKFYI